MVKRLLTNLRMSILYLIFQSKKGKNQILISL